MRDVIGVAMVHRVEPCDRDSSLSSYYAPVSDCVVGQGDLLVSNNYWPNEFDPASIIYPLDLGKSQINWSNACHNLVTRINNQLSVFVLEQVWFSVIICAHFLQPE